MKKYIDKPKPMDQRIFEAALEFCVRLDDDRSFATLCDRYPKLLEAFAAKLERQAKNPRLG